MSKLGKIVLLVMIAGAVTFQGCAWWKKPPEGKETLLDVKTYDRYAKIVALAVYDRTGTGQDEVVEQFRRALTARLQKALGKVHLVTIGDPDFPDYLEALPSSAKGGLDNLALAQAARADGFQALVLVSLEALVPQAEKKGMFWWRKDRFFLQTYLKAEIFDPVTAAKPLSIIEEVKSRLERDDFEFFEQQDWRLPEYVQEAIIRRAKDLAKRISKALDELRWQVTLSAVDGGKAVLPSGQRAGIKVGDRLAVFGIEGVVEGVEGETFMAPGFRKGGLTVEKVAPGFCEVKIEGRAAVGDIAVPVR